MFYSVTINLFFYFFLFLFLHHQRPNGNDRRERKKNTRTHNQEIMIILLLLSDDAAVAAAASMALPFACSQFQLNSLDWIMPRILVAVIKMIWRINKNEKEKKNYYYIARSSF